MGAVALEIRSAETPRVSELVARSLDAHALELRAALETIAIPLARHARACVAREIWKAAGFRNVHDYARERCARSGRWLTDLARLDAGLERHPELALAFAGADGGRPLGVVPTLLLCRLGASAPLADWIRFARSVSVRQLRRALTLTLAREDRGDVGPPPAGDDAFPAAADDATGQDRTWVSIAAPASVRAAFDEVLELYRAMCGDGATVTSFVEALVGESRAGADGPTVAAGGGRGIRVGIARRWVRDAFREERLRTQSHDWAELDAPRGAHPSSMAILRAAGQTLADWRVLVQQAGSGGAADLDETLARFLEWERVARVRLGQVLAVLSLERLWPMLQFTSARHYGEERLGLPERTVADLLRLGRAVPRWRALEAAYVAGDVSTEKALLLVRMTETSCLRVAQVEAWVGHAAACTVKRLRDEVRAWRRRDLDGSTAVPRDGSAPTACAPMTAEQWMDSVRRDGGTAIARVARAGLAAERESAADVFLVLRLPAEVADDFVGELERWGARLDAEVRDLATPPAGTPAMRVAWAHARGGARRVPAWVALLAMLENFAGAFDRPGSRRGPETAEALAAAGYRCQVPGCTSRSVEVHHIQPRAQGGADARDNFVALCPFHHRSGVHAGLAEVSRSGDVDLVWRIGSGLLETWYRNEILVVSRP